MKQGNIQTFDEYFNSQVKKYGQLPCLTDGENGQMYTYENLNLKVNQALNLFQELNLKEGDRFATIMENTPEFIISYLASMKLGTLIAPLAIDLPSKKIKDIFNNLKISIAIVDRKTNEKLNEIEDELKYLKRVFVINGKGNENFNKALSNMPKRVDDTNHPHISTPSSLYFSSGTTGTPKGICQSPNNLLTAAESLASAYGFSVEDTQMGILPNYHTALVTYGFWPSFCVGSNFVIFKKFSTHNFWKNIEKHRITFVETVPTILVMLMNPPEDVSKYDISALKFIGSGSAPLSPEVQQRFEDTFGVLVANKYGLSETEPTHFNPPQRERRKEGSIGKPLSMCEVGVVNTNRTFCRANEIGEIVIRGENVVNSYYNDPEATASAFKNGWFYTGDLGYFDEEGFYFLAGRKKEIIIRGGANIYPDEIDRVLYTHPDVVDAASYGVPDEIYGEEIKTSVVLRKGSNISEEDLIEYCNRNLEKYKCPKEINFVNKIPKTHSGKIIRRKMSKTEVD
jgi:long-chain acyl-CoA synthetase